MASGNGRILTSNQADELGGGMNVVINVSTPDAGLFRASPGQIAQQVGHAIQKALRRQG